MKFLYKGGVMSDLELTSAFELASLSYQDVQVDDEIFIQATLEVDGICPKCGSTHVHRKTLNHRILHLPPLGRKKCKLQVLTQKRRCVDCEYSWWPEIPFADGKERMTRSFKNYALDLLCFGTIQDVARHLGVSWDSIKDLHKNFLRSEYAQIDFSDVQRVSIDEFSIAKRHKYMTIFVDIPTGRIIHAVEGRKKTDIQAFLKELKKKHPTCKQFAWT
jgi:transposase